MQNLSPLHEATEGADFPKLDPDSVGVAGGVAYNLVLLTGIPVSSSGMRDLSPLLGSDARTKLDLFLCIYFIFIYVFIFCFYVCIYFFYFLSRILKHYVMYIDQ